MYFYEAFHIPPETPSLPHHIDLNTSLANLKYRLAETKEKNDIENYPLLYKFICSTAIDYSPGSPDFYISNQGKDIYPGTTPFLARKTISATTPLIKELSTTKAVVAVGLQSGSVFNENLITSYPIHLQTYAETNNDTDFAVINGTKDFSLGWIQQDDTEFTYVQAVPYKGFTDYGINGIGSYSYLYVFETDKTLEKTVPFTARHPLQFVTSLTALENTPGSFYYPPNTTENPKPIFIHTSDGNSPNQHQKYRYEVTVKDFAVNSTYEQNNIFENLWVRGFGAGIGMLPGGDNSYYNKIIFGPGAGIHHLVVRNGIIDHSLFLPGSKNTSEFAVVFYDVEGLSRHSIIRNSIFLDIPAPVYSHISLGTNYGALEMDRVVGFADTSQRRGFMFTSNTDTVLLDNIYAEGYACGYNYGTAKIADIKNSYFKDVNFGIAYSAQNPVTASLDNVFIKTKDRLIPAGYICRIIPRCKSIIQYCTFAMLMDLMEHCRDHLFTTR